MQAVKAISAHFLTRSVDVAVFPLICKRVCAINGGGEGRADWLSPSLSSFQTSGREEKQQSQSATLSLGSQAGRRPLFGPEVQGKKKKYPSQPRRLCLFWFHLIHAASIENCSRVPVLINEMSCTESMVSFSDLRPHAVLQQRGCWCLVLEVWVTLCRPEHRTLTRVTVMLSGGQVILQWSKCGQHVYLWKIWNI